MLRAFLFCFEMKGLQEPMPRPFLTQLSLFREDWQSACPHLRIWELRRKQRK